METLRIIGIIFGILGLILSVFGEYLVDRYLYKKKLKELREELKSVRGLK